MLYFIFGIDTAASRWFPVDIFKYSKKLTWHELFSCVCWILVSTWSENHTGHTSVFCHCALLLYDPEDYHVL